MAEAAGVVLAVIPLVISALERYAEGVSTITKWWSYKRELNSLVRVLDAEYARFLGTCEKLLHGLVTPAELKALLAKPGGPLWQNKALDKKLKIRLERSYSSYLRFVEDMASAVKALEVKLELGPNGKPLWGDYHTFKHEYKRVRFSLSRRGYEEYMKRIEKNNDMLASLTEQNMELEPSRKRRRRAGPQFKSIQQHAQNLYSVINRGLSCNCSKPHQANLRLDDRLADGDDHDGNRSREPHLETPIVQFNVLFSVECKSSLQGVWQETEIRILDNEEMVAAASSSGDAYTVLRKSGDSTACNIGSVTDQAITAAQHLSMISTSSLNVANSPSNTTHRTFTLLPKKAVKFVEQPPITCSKPAIFKDKILSDVIKNGMKFADSPSTPVSIFYPSLSKEDYPNLVKIENLCMTIQQCMENIRFTHRCIGYMSFEAHYHLGLYLPSIPEKSRPNHKIKSLAKLLSPQQTSPHQFLAATGNLTLRRGDRLVLALTLASSVLQLYKTPWLREYWDKNDIMISGDCIRDVREQVYVSRSFPPTKGDSSNQAFMLPLRNVTLFALGIVLIELCLGQTLESMRGFEDQLDSSGNANVLTDWSTANRMTEAVYSEAGTRYGDAVRRCLHCDFDQRNTSLDNDAFRQAVYDGVVAPLQEDVNDFFQR